nr:putative ribonuclease H-like domain-containing protein [Tanacetum cinerariifolium]
MATIHQKTDPALLQFCLFSCFLSQVEPKKVSDALQDLSWVEAMQEELLQFKIQKVWTLVDCPKGAHDALLESSSSKLHYESSSQVPKGSRNPNPTASSSNPPADQMEILTVESPIPTVSSPVPTAYLNDSPKPSSEARLISKSVANQEETTSLDNILSLTNRFEDILGVTTSSDETIGVEADVSNMESSISASPTHTLIIYTNHPKSQIIGPVDTPIQTRHKSKMMEEQSFIATINQKTDPALL